MNPQTKPPRKAMSLTDMTHALADGLRRTLEETDTGYLERDPEEAFLDFALRLIVRLQSKITIVPAPGPAERIRLEQTKAATRIFNIFTHWMLKHPGCSYDTRMSATGKFQIVVKTPNGTTRLFFGETVQDAYAQAAQTLAFESET